MDEEHFDPKQKKVYYSIRALQKYQSRLQRSLRFIPPKPKGSGTPSILPTASYHRISENETGHSDKKKTISIIFQRQDKKLVCA